MAQLVRNVNICPTAANAMPPFAPEFAQHQMRYESQCADTSAFCVEFDATNFREVGQQNNRIDYRHRKQNYRIETVHFVNF